MKNLIFATAPIVFIISANCVASGDSLDSLKGFSCAALTLQSIVIGHDCSKNQGNCFVRAKMPDGTVREFQFHSPSSANTDDIGFSIYCEGTNVQKNVTSNDIPQFCSIS